MSFFGKPSVDRLKARGDVNGLIRALRRSRDSVEERRRAIRALVEIGAAAVDTLITALNDEDKDVRKSAVAALGEIGDTRAAEPLIAALKDEHGHVRELSARALGRIGDARAVEPLIATLVRGDHGYVREASAEALGRIGDARAIEPLVAALHEWSLSKTVALALECLGWQPGRDGSAVRYWMAKQEWEECAALGAVATETCVALLEESARLGAFAQSLFNLEGFSRPGMGWGTIGWMHGEECVEMREAATGVLVRIGAPAVPFLVDKLQDHGLWVKMTVAWALGELKDARAVTPLIALLKDPIAHRDEECPADLPRQAAAEALVKIGPHAVGQLITELENDDRDTRRLVVWALGEIRDARAIAPLTAMLRDESVREVVAEALAKIGMTDKRHQHPAEQ